MIKITSKKALIFAAIVIANSITIVMVGIIGMGGFAMYVGSSRQQCDAYASSYAKQTGLPESMNYYSLYVPCRESKGLRGFAF
jgi:hypothetical protein